MVCYRHVKTETAVRCGKCDRPICTRCMVSGPVGMRCPDCASLRASPLYRIAPARLLLAVCAGLLTGLIGAWVLTMISFFVFFVGPFYGGLVAEAVLRAAGRKRGRALEIIGVGSIVLGAVLTCLPRLLFFVKGAGALPYAGAGLSLVWPLIGFALAIGACYARLQSR
jgi:hypothetical protein